MKKLLFAVPTALALTTGAASAFELTSNLVEGQSLTPEYFWDTFGCTGENRSPALQWSKAPAGTKSFAVTFYDKDAPTGSGFWHYVLYDIPAAATSLDAGALSAGKLPKGAREGNTDLGKPGFFGPCPPVGRRHNYVYTVHALKVDKLDVPAGATAALTGFFIYQQSLGAARLNLFAGPRP